MNIIALTGIAGSGKSTTAKALIALRPGTVPMSLAAPFKLRACALFSVFSDEVFGPTPKSAHTRTLLQEMGTECGRKIYGDDFWTRHADADLYRLRQYGIRTVVIDDVRFQNEADWALAHGALLVKLEGRGGLTGEAANHPSETEAAAITGYHVRLDTGITSPPVVADEILWALACRDDHQ